MNENENMEMKLCPFCGEEILQVAIKCKYCKSFLESKPTNEKPPGDVKHKADNKKFMLLFIIILLLATLGTGGYFLFNYLNETGLPKDSADGTETGAGTGTETETGAGTEEPLTEAYGQDHAEATEEDLQDLPGEETVNLLNYIGKSKEDIIKILGEPDELDTFQDANRAHFFNYGLEVYYFGCSGVDCPDDIKNEIIAFGLYGNSPFLIDGHQLIGKTFSELEKELGRSGEKYFSEYSSQHVFSYTIERYTINCYADRALGEVNGVQISITN